MRHELEKLGIYGNIVGRHWIFSNTDLHCFIRSTCPDGFSGIFYITKWDWLSGQTVACLADDTCFRGRLTFPNIQNTKRIYISEVHRMATETDPCWTDCNSRSSSSPNANHAHIDLVLIRLESCDLTSHQTHPLKTSQPSFWYRLLQQLPYSRMIQPPHLQHISQLSHSTQLWAWRPGLQSKSSVKWDPRNFAHATNKLLQRLKAHPSARTSLKLQSISERI